MKFDLITLKKTYAITIRINIILFGYFVLPVSGYSELQQQLSNTPSVTDPDGVLFPERNIDMDYDANADLNPESMIEIKTGVTSESQSTQQVIIKPAPINKFKISFETGIAYDSNIYRSPSEDYIDYAKGSTLTPTTVYSDAYIPVNLNVKYFGDLHQKNTFVAEYQFKSSTYTNSDFNNANQILHKIDLGFVSKIYNRKKQKNILYSGVFAGYKKRLYVDRDTGENQQSGLSDISERYTYNYVGIELKHHFQNNNFVFDSALDFQSRDYNSTPGSSLEYDNVQLGISGKLTLRTSKATKIHSNIKIYSMDYDKRPSRDSGGTLSTINPNRQYLYTIFSTGLRHRLSKAWLVYFDVDNKSRFDQYVGYDNYSKLRLKARLHYRLSNQFKIKLSASSWTRDYENAYAFDNPNYGVNKSYNGTTIKLSSLYDFSDTTKLNISYLQKNEDSTDLRYVYDRAILSANLEWIF